MHLVLKSLKSLSVRFWFNAAVFFRQNLFLVMEYLPGGDFMSLLECIVQLEEQVPLHWVVLVSLLHLA